MRNKSFHSSEVSPLTVNFLRTSRSSAAFMAAVISSVRLALGEEIHAWTPRDIHATRNNNANLREYHAWYT